MNDTREAPPSSGPADPGPRRRGLGSLLETRRTRDDRLVGGVCSGVARQLDIDPVLVRILAVVLCFVGLAGFILYVGAWLFLPAEDEARSHVAEWFGVDEREEQVRSGGLLATAIFAGLAVIGDGGWGWGGFWAFWVMVWVVGPVALVAWLVSRNRRSRQGRGDAVAGPPPAPTAPAGTSTVAATAADPTPTTVLDLDPDAPRGSTPPPAAPPVAPPTPVAPRPRRPRERFTWVPTLLALWSIAIATAITRLVADPEWIVYVAVALAVTGGALVLSTFTRGGGPLVLLGLVLAAVLAVGSFLPSPRLGEQRVDPFTASEVQDEYRHGMGIFVLDLSDVDDPDELLGRTVRVETGFGQTRIVLPADLEVTVDARVGAGDLRVLGEQTEGTAQRLLERGDGDVLTLDVAHSAGQVEVTRR